MAEIALDRLRHAYVPGEWALREVRHVWQDGGAYALLGPSGCGKTTLLNLVSGLLRPTEGRILFDGRDVTGLPPEARNIAQVFQFPVVYDSMSVRENLAFPLRNRRLPEAAVRARVDEVIAMIGLEAEAERPARGLTADLKQKVSLGRGLVRSDVSAILFDEPLTVIDPHAKWELRSQLKALHRRFGHTMVYVTHDQTEALTFADTVVVMEGGGIVQIGTPAELFERPAHRFVGHFIGSPGMNLLPAVAEGDQARVGEHAIPLPGVAPVSLAGQPVELGVRPERVRLGDAASGGVPARVVRVDDVGRERVVRLELAGHALAAVLREDEPLPPEPHVRFDPAGVHLYADGWRVPLAGEDDSGARNGVGDEGRARA